MDSRGRMTMDRNRNNFCPSARRKGTRVAHETESGIDRVPATLSELRAFTAEAFENLHDGNPLKHMGEEDQELVCGWPMLFVRERDGLDDHLHRIEQAAQIASDAVELATRMQKLFLRNPLPEDENPLPGGLSAEHHDLPARLHSFANGVNGVRQWTDHFGKTAVKRQRVRRDLLLVGASEWVKSKTGTWNDEHLAELLQSISFDLEDFSGDAIRKRRERFKQDYPKLYLLAATRANLGRYVRAKKLNNVTPIDGSK
jgi:hypothetical protein